MVKISDLPDGRFTKEHLREASEELLKFLSEERIDSTESLEGRVDTRVDLRGGSKIRIALQEDSEGLKFYVISYETTMWGAPISLSIDPYEFGFLIFIESVDEISNYSNTGPNHLGNFVQYREIDSKEGDLFPSIIRELEALRGYNL